MSGSAAALRSTDIMKLSEEEILRTLMNSRDRIAAAAWLVVRDTQAAEDIFQNVALKAITRDVQFANAGAALSWAFVAARREGIDWLRRRRRETRGLNTAVLELVEQHWLTESPTAAGTRLDALRECLDAVPQKSRTLLNLRYFEGFSCGEVAQQLGAELNAIYKRLSRLHHGLRNCIEMRLSEASGLGGTSGLGDTEGVGRD